MVCYPNVIKSTISENEEGSKQLITEFNLKESAYMIADAWDRVKKQKL